MSEKLYGHYDGLMDYDTYPEHVMAMTAEGLHSKSEIAAELAYRDQRIAELEQEVEELREAVDNTLVNGYEYLPSCGEKYLIDADDFDKLAALLREKTDG